MTRLQTDEHKRLADSEARKKTGKIGGRTSARAPGVP